MARCQCLKLTLKQCTRKASIKSDSNKLYCWQHQICVNVKPVLLKKVKQ